MFTEFTDWLFKLLKAFFTTLWDFVTDAFVHLLDLVLGAVVALLSLIPVPSFLSDGLHTLFANLDPGILWFASTLGLLQGLGFIGAGYLFRLVRKVVTLFQW